MKTKILYSLLLFFPIIASAQVCDINTDGYFKTSGQAQMMEDAFTFGFNGKPNKKLFIKKVCFEADEIQVLFSFMTNTELFHCTSGDCCKLIEAETLVNENLNIKADKETGLTWEVEGCYLD